MRKRKLENLVKRGDKYYIDYYDKQTKQRIRISTGTDIEDVAKEFRDNYFYNLKHNSQQNNNVGYINNNQEYIFDDIALKFLNDKKRTCRINTYKKYQSKMKNLAKFFTTKTLNSINKLIISNYCDYRFMNGCNQSLLREELSVLNNIFNYAVELDMMLNNPLLSFKFKKKYEDYKPRLRYLSIEEINKILNVKTSNELIKIQVIILLETGLRVNEAMNILFTDISIDTQTKIPFLIIRKENEISIVELNFSFDEIFDNIITKSEFEEKFKSTVNTLFSKANLGQTTIGTEIPNDEIWIQSSTNNFTINGEDNGD